MAGRINAQRPPERSAVQSVTSADVNAYLREVAGADITAKDFRTWNGTVMAAVALAEIGPATSGSCCAEAAEVAGIRRPARQRQEPKRLLTVPSGQEHDMTEKPTGQRPDDKPQKPADEPRHFSHGGGGAMADAASENSPRREDHHPDSPHSRPAQPLAEDEVHDQLAEKEAASEDRDEARLDEAVEESFPASDPASAHHIT
jgi:hypothetical protein